MNNCTVFKYYINQSRGVYLITLIFVITKLLLLFYDSTISLNLRFQFNNFVLLKIIIVKCIGDDVPLEKIANYVSRYLK